MLKRRILTGIALLLMIFSFVVLTACSSRSEKISPERFAGLEERYPSWSNWLWINRPSNPAPAESSNNNSRTTGIQPAELLAGN